jgi:putative DNA primase/helicase
MSSDSPKIVDFPKTALEENARRLKVEVERLARLPTVESMYYIENPGYADKYGIDKATLERMVKAEREEIEKKAQQEQVEQHQREDRAERARKTARSEQQQAHKEQAQEQKRARREEAQRRKELAKELQAIAKLPQVAHELRLQELSKRLAADVDALREQLQFFIIPEETGRDYLVDDIEPWSEPVDVRVLLQELVDQLRRYVVIHGEGVVAVALWIMFVWVHEAAWHSPPLLITSADPVSGKSTLARVAGQLCPRLKKAAEPTLASIYRTIHRYNPTLLLDEADTVFMRNASIAHLINESWEKGSSVPRIGAKGQIQNFNIFGPKIIAMKGEQLPETTASRCIAVKMVPRLEREKVENFRYRDDDRFRELRRKCLRWAADNIEQLENVEPTMPPGVISRAAANWRLPLAVADLAGGDMSKHARAVVVKLLASSEEIRLTEGQRLLLAIEEPLKAQLEWLTQDMLAHLRADPTSEWCNFRGRGKLNEWQLAKLLKPYGVRPRLLHPIPGSTKGLRGYRYEDFKRLQVFERHIPATARNRTTAQVKPKKPRK